jgi:hypothetical protein
LYRTGESWATALLTIVYQPAANSDDVRAPVTAEQNGRSN